MSLCGRLDGKMFPYDFTEVNSEGGFCLTPPFYTLYRIGFMLAVATDFGYSAYFYQPTDLLYFTNWGLILTLLCSVVMCVQNVLNWCLQFKTTLKYWKVSHFIFTVTLVFEMFINGIYWGVLFPYALINLWGHQGLYDILNPIMQHAVPLILLLIDLQFNLVVVWNFMYIPFYLLILICYLITNCVYTLEISPIYDMINYQTYLTYLFLLGCAVTILVCLLIARVFCKYCKQQRILALFPLTDKSTINTQRRITKPSSDMMQTDANAAIEMLQYH